MSRMLRDLPAEDVTLDHLCECVGIELNMAQGLSIHVAEMKRAHMLHMLSEHRIKKGRAFSYIKEIVRVSQESSKWMRNRARYLALAYHELD